MRTSFLIEEEKSSRLTRGTAKTNPSSMQRDDREKTSSKRGQRGKDPSAFFI
jgi:hypothetical protein